MIVRHLLLPELGKGSSQPIALIGQAMAGFNVVYFQPAEGHEANSGRLHPQGETYGFEKT
jgi:hypothetical protein